MKISEFLSHLSKRLCRMILTKVKRNRYLFLIMGIAIVILAVIALVFTVFSSPIPNELSLNEDMTADLPTGYNFLNQTIDHFNSNDKRIWKMRFATNKRYYKPGGSIVIYIGGESPISDDNEIFNSNELLVSVAEKTNSVLFHTEHRFYGLSQPFDDLKLENLQYLTMDQITADIANFIRTIKHKKTGLQNAKVILAGCSYSGTVVARFLQLYPDLANGGWSSGALQLSKPDYEYIDVAGETLKKINGKCFDFIRNAIKDAEKSLFVTKDSVKIQNMLGSCGDKDLSSIEINYLDVVQNIVGAIVQNNDHYGINSFCNELLSYSNNGKLEETLTSLTEFAGLSSYYRIPNEEFLSCSNYTHLVKGLNNLNTQRVYTYQGCIELGVNAPSKNLFEHRQFESDIHLKVCEDEFKISKDQVKKNIEKYNERFGGLNPNITNIIWSSGDMDPWRGVQVKNNPDGSSAVIQNVNHCGEWTDVSNYDEEPVKTMKTRIKNQLIKWLTTGN